MCNHTRGYSQRRQSSTNPLPFFLVPGLFWGISSFSLFFLCAVNLTKKKKKKETTVFMIRKTGWLSNAKQTTSFYFYSLECEESSPLTFNAAAPSCCVSVSSCLLTSVSKVMLFCWFLSVSTSLVHPPPTHTHTHHTHTPNFSQRISYPAFHGHSQHAARFPMCCLEYYEENGG